MLINNLKNEQKQVPSIKEDMEKSVKHFPSSVREWNNSIYVYNLNTLKSIPYAENLAMNVIRGYFSAYNKSLEKFTRTKKIKNKSRKYSSNKIYVSNGEFKHTNNKVLINLYIYNRQKINYVSFMNSWYKKYLKWNLNKAFINRLKYINNKTYVTMQKTDEKRMLLLSNISNLRIYKHMSKYLDFFYKMLLNKAVKKIKIYFFYKQLLYINKSLVNYNYLQYLKKYLELLYNKNVEFNLINTKKFYSNSDILSESILMKITRNRRKLSRYLKLFKNKIEIDKKKAYYGEKKEKKNLNDRQIVEKSILENLIINNLEYKKITGFRLKVKGRITRRNTASRSKTRVKYNGNLLDLDSSTRGLSTVLLKGNQKSNLQKTQLKSKTRIGSFGLKGWVSAN